jgi:WD40 repeat protein
MWDATTGKEVGAPLQHQDSVNTAAFSPDGQRMLTASDDHTARVWDAETGKEVGAAFQHQGPVNSAAFSPDGRRVVTASSDHTARVWDAETGKAVSSPLQHQGPVSSAVFSPDGRRVVTASQDNTARIWDVLLDCCASQSEADRLASLAETLSGLAVSETGALYPVEYDRREKLAELTRSAKPNAPRLSLDWLIRDLARRFQIIGQ